MRALLAMLLSIVVVAPAAAWSDLERMTTANALGSVLGSEKACGLSYKQDAIERFIEKKVPASDMEFATNLTMMTTGNRVQVDEMSPSQKAAHCRQISRVAKSYGFTD